MKFFVAIFFLLSLSLAAFSQAPAAAAAAGGGDVLATVNRQNFTVQDLPPNVREVYEKRAAIIADLRTELFARQVADVLLETEAAARKTTVDKLLTDEMRRRVPDPTDAQIQAVYNANREAIRNRPQVAIRS